MSLCSDLMMPFTRYRPQWAQKGFAGAQHKERAPLSHPWSDTLPGFCSGITCACADCHPERFARVQGSLSGSPTGRQAPDCLYASRLPGPPVLQCHQALFLRCGSPLMLPCRVSQPVQLCPRTSGDIPLSSRHCSDPAPRSFTFLPTLSCLVATWAVVLP